MTSKRRHYIILLGITVALGLLSRSSVVPEESPIRLYAGDALWALSLFWAIAVIFDRTTTSRLVVSALIISFLIETSQFYHEEWIEQLRSYRLGALFLGFQFRWLDLVCYTVGIWLGATINHYGIRKKRLSPLN